MHLFFIYTDLNKFIFNLIYLFNIFVLAVFPRHRYQDKVQVPGQDDPERQKTSQYWPIIGYDEHLTVLPVLSLSVSSRDGVWTGPVRCLVAGAAERAQELLYFYKNLINPDLFRKLFF
jgi:hypothetical protein